MSVQVILNTGLGGDFYGSPQTISVAGSASNAAITIPPGKWYVFCPSGVTVSLNLGSGTYLPFPSGALIESDGESGIFAASNTNSSAANITLIQIKGAI
ncbi:MAG TPA: hypothetical protein ENO30_04340 [Thermodesulfobium narugense]|nr:hypothetical protein [Thermodesulfobium narugense]